MPHEGWNSATVPGAVAAWVALSKRFGRLPFADLFEPAIRYASDGFLVSPTIAMIWGNQVERLQRPAGLCRDVSAARPRADRRRAFSPLRTTRRRFKKIAETGGESFYRGELAETIAQASASGGGFMTTDDLAAHRLRLDRRRSTSSSAAIASTSCRRTARASRR